MRKIVCLLVLSLIMMLAVFATDDKISTIDDLNTNIVVGSHAEDDINTASLEASYRDKVELTATTTWSIKYDKAYYPRVKKIKEDLYLLLFMPGHYGGTDFYYTTSADGKTWEEPKTGWNKTDKSFTYTYGSRAGTTDRLLVANPEACVLNNGEIILVYAVRAEKGYGNNEYAEYQGVFMKRGTVDADNRIVWGEETRLTYGRVWEPFVWQRPDGRVEMYWTNGGAFADYLGIKYQPHTLVSMVYSDDNGHTWTPNLEAGKENGLAFYRVYQEIVGELLVESDEYDPLTAPRFNAQMPVVTALYNGKTLLATEIHDDGKYSTTIATSPVGGDWKNLGVNEDGTEETGAVKNVGSAGPYVVSFPSGEAYLTYNQGNKMVGRLVSPDGKTVSFKTIAPVPEVTNGWWGATEVVGSHKVLSVFPFLGSTTKSGVYISTSYLNHRVEANKIDIELDGDTDDWVSNTDALFVGSDSQAQATLQIAHDNENLYFCINRLDYYLTNEDTVTVCIAADTLSDYRITTGFDGTTTVAFYKMGKRITSSVVEKAAVLIKGSLNDNSDKDEGAIIEIAVPKLLVDLKDADTFAVRFAFSNNDGNGVRMDTMDGVSTLNTNNWPKVSLK